MALVVLGLSIWAFVAPCKKDPFENNNNCKYCKNCPSRGKAVTSVKSLDDLNKICKNTDNVDCSTLGTIYVDVNWACNNTAYPGDVKVMSDSMVCPLSPPY